MQNGRNLIGIALLLTFPVAVYTFQNWDRKEVPENNLSAATIVPELNEAVEAKIKEVADVEVKILQAQGEVLKHKEQRTALIKDLEHLQAKIKPIIEQARK